ncbi:MAG: hypothetical protein MK066_05440 [Crocinitomicaceae bacterium]|nr:hypothetical protein [Crocinitomicaceae bacterium]
MRKAIIDLGTNTFNLLIADPSSSELNTLHVEKEAVMLGMGGINEGILTLDAINRAFNSLKRFKARCSLFSVEKIIAIGTSALRSAKNAKVLLERVKKELGIDIQIIDGDQEARFIYQGTKWGYDFSKSSVIMDIGGGSTEYIIANRKGIERLTSLDIGVSRVFQSLGKPKEFDANSQLKVISFLKKNESNFFLKAEVDILVGASGSFETFYEMIYQKRFDSVRAEELELSTFIEVLEWTINSTLEERLKNDWIVPMRKEMLPIAALKVRWTMEKLGIKKVYVSPFSLKEGVLME